jgi:anti-sigma regulatory factor (Ser/Thr protein kinase)
MVPVEAEDIAIETGAHVVQFYEHDADLIATVGGYLTAAVRAGDVAVVIATPDHRQAFEAELDAAGIDVAGARRRRAFVAVDAAETMARFIVDGRIDKDRFTTVIGGLIRRAGATGRSVRAYGEMVALLWDADDVMAAIELETLWNELGRQLRFSLFCGYSTSSVAGSEHSHAFQQVCHLHSAILDRGSRPRHHEVSRRFPGRLDAPRAARSFVADTLQRWGFVSLVDDAMLTMSELATNAIVHADSPFTVVIASEADTVRLSVRDQSTLVPTRRDNGPMAQSGRGIDLVSVIADRWGIEVLPDGKVVWAELRRPNGPEQVLSKTPN